MPFDEGSASVFFGRVDEVAALYGLVAREDARVVALTGEAGVGKTSLLRAGLAPGLAAGGVTPLYLDAREPFEQALLQAASRTRIELPHAGEAPSDYLVRLARTSREGTVLLYDHVEALLGDDVSAEQVARVVAALVPIVSGVGPSRLRLVLSVDARSFHRLERLAPVVPPTLAGSALELGRFVHERAAEVLEQTALQTGTFMEAGLAGVVAADLCRRGPCLPLDLQLLGRVLMDRRLTSIRRYERSGGADVLVPAYFEAVVQEAGGRNALRVLLDLLESGATAAEALAGRTRLPRPVVDRALATFVARGLVGKRDDGRAERFDLAHPALAARLDEFAGGARAGVRRARRLVRARSLAGGRLSIPELLTVRRHLGGSLAGEEEATVRRSTRRAVFQVSLAALLASAVFVLLYADMRSSYTLALAPDGDAAGARVVVRAGRPDRAILRALPNQPRFGTVLADTGFAASGLADDLARRIRQGRAMGKLDRNAAPVPAWMSSVLAGLRPVPRGVASALLGDASGIISLKQAFSDPLARRETLEALAVIGRGRAGEDEILAAALADADAEVRRRGVEVAAAIDRRLGRGSHAATLRSALSDRSTEVRETVLRECATLPPAEQAGVLSVALADPDPAFRRLAERAILALAATAPADAAEAAKAAAKSSDTLRRRGGLALLEQISAKSSATEAATTLADLVADTAAPEETRVAALLLLRRAGPPPASLAPVVEQAVAPEASPRLRAAALPLYARLADPAKAEEIALAESRGPAPARAAGAAVWGVVAATKPDAAAKALKGMLYDSAVEVRIEAARAYGSLRREGPGLVQKALLDPNPDVQKAALESAVALASANTWAITDMLGKAIKNVRPGVRRDIVAALARIGDSKPAIVVVPLARGLKETDAATREAIANALCTIGRKNAQVASPYLRLAARDDDRDVRAAAAACLEALAAGDPKGAARIASELAEAKEGSVRLAAARSLGLLADEAKDGVIAPLLRLLEDPDRPVREAALEAMGRVAEAGVPLGKRSEDLERALAALFARNDREERTAAIKVAGQHGLVSILRQAAADDDEAARLAGIRAAAASKPPVLELLRGATSDRSAVVRAEAVRLLVGAAGTGASDVVSIFEGMLRAGDPEVRRSGARGLGELTGAEDAAVRLLIGALGQRSETVRAAVAESLGRVAERGHEAALAPLERCLGDAAHDVRLAAARGLAASWAKRQSPEALVEVLVASEADSARRFVALEALVLKAEAEAERDAVDKALGRIGETSPPLARLAAEIGRAFLGRPAESMKAFVDRLLGG